MDVKAVTQQKLTAVKEELLALIRGEKSFEEGKEDLRRLMGKQSTKDALERLAMFIPPAYNIATIVYTWTNKDAKRDVPFWKRVGLTAENVALYSGAGAMFALMGMPPAYVALTVAELFPEISAVEWFMIKAKGQKVEELKSANGGETVAYIMQTATGMFGRGEDGKRYYRLHESMRTAAVNNDGTGSYEKLGDAEPRQHGLRLGESDGTGKVVGYVKVTPEGKAYEYTPLHYAKYYRKGKPLPEKESDPLNWGNGTKPGKMREYFLTQYQVLAYFAMAYEVVRQYLPAVLAGPMPHP